MLTMLDSSNREDQQELLNWSVVTTLAQTCYAAYTVRMLSGDCGFSQVVHCATTSLVVGWGLTASQGSMDGEHLADDAAHANKRAEPSGYRFADHTLPYHTIQYNTTIQQFMAAMYIARGTAADNSEAFTLHMMISRAASIENCLHDQLLSGSHGR
jgi:hypothetical protein